MESRLVPDVFDRVEYPNKSLNVEFQKGVKMESGNLLKLSSLSKLPHVSWDADDFKLYTVAIFDPDASSVIDPNRECLQFLAYNVKGSNLNTGKIFADYLPPTLSKEKPRHRLVFAVYEQQGEIFPIEKPLSNEFVQRCDFHLQDWRKRYNLGNPIAVNYFESEWDESQPLPGTGLLTTIVEGVQSSMHYLGEKMQAGYETVKEGMHELRERVHEKKEELRQLAEEKKEEIKEGAQDLQQQFQEKKEDIKQEFQEKKAEVREQPKIDFRQGETVNEPVIGHPIVQKRIEQFESISTRKEDLPPGNFDTLSTEQRTITTQPVITSTSTQPVITSTSTQPVAPSLLTKVAEGIQTGVHVLGENLQAGYEVLKENVVAGAGVVKEKVQAGAEVVKEKVQEGACVVKENLQAGLEVAKDKVAQGYETVKEGTLNIKEDLKTGVQNVKQNIQAGVQVAKENIQIGAQKVTESLAPTTTTTTTTTTTFIPSESFNKPTFSTSGSTSSSGSDQFPSEREQINRFENLAAQNENLTFLNEGEPAKESRLDNPIQPYGGEDIAIAQGYEKGSGINPNIGGTFTNQQPSNLGGFNQPTNLGGFNQPYIGGYNQPTNTFGSSNTEKKPNL